MLNQITFSIIKDKVEFNYTNSKKYPPRLTLEKECIDTLGIKENKIVLQGMGNHVNIWEKSVFDELIRKNENKKEHQKSL